MDKKLKIRIMIAIASVFAATLVIGLSTGIVEYWTKGIGYFVDGGYRIQVSVLVSENDIALKNNESVKISAGEIAVRRVEIKDERSEVTIELKSELSYGGADVISDKTLKGTKKSVMKVFCAPHELTFESQTIEKDKIVAVYFCDFALPEDAEFVVSDVILNEFSRE